MPGTLVLNGVRSPRTYASSVTCSTLPPSHAFQLRVMVIKTARPSATTRRGVRYFFHPSRPREAAEGLSLSAGSGFVTGAGTGEVDIKIGSFSCKKSANAALFMTQLLGPFACQDLPRRSDRLCFFLDRGHDASQGNNSFLTLGQWKLRCELHIDHRADAAVELKEGRCFFSWQDCSENRHVALTQFCLFDVGVQPAANKIVGLGIGQGSVFVRIFFDNRRSRVVDLSSFHRVLFVHLPEFCRFAIREGQIRGNQLLLDRADIPA